MKEPQKVPIIAGGILERDDKFLLVNAKVGIPKGLWNNPGGRTDEGETVEEAASREVKEETGFDTEIEGLVGIYHRLKHGAIVRIQFKMKIIGGELDLPKDEIEEAKWFSLEEIKQMDDSKFAWGTKEAIFDYIERGSKKQKQYSTKRDII